MTTLGFASEESCRTEGKSGWRQRRKEIGQVFIIGYRAINYTILLYYWICLNISIKTCFFQVERKEGGGDRGVHAVDLASCRNLKLSSKREAQVPPRSTASSLCPKSHSASRAGEQMLGGWPRQWFRSHGSELDNSLRGSWLSWPGGRAALSLAQAEGTEEWNQLWALIPFFCGHGFQREHFLVVKVALSYLEGLISLERYHLSQALEVLEGFQI